MRSASVLRWGVLLVLVVALAACMPPQPGTWTITATPKAGLQPGQLFTVSGYAPAGAHVEVGQCTFAYPEGDPTCPSFATTTASTNGRWSTQLRAVDFVSSHSRDESDGLHCREEACPVWVGDNIRQDGPRASTSITLAGGPITAQAAVEAQLPTARRLLVTGEIPEAAGQIAAVVRCTTDIVISCIDAQPFTVGADDRFSVSYTLADDGVGGDDRRFSLVIRPPTFGWKYGFVAAPPINLAVSPIDELTEGETVTLTGTEGVPGQVLQVLLCGENRCDVVLGSLTVGADGRAATTVAVDPVLPNGDCRTRNTCFLMLRAEDGFRGAVRTPISFARPTIRLHDVAAREGTGGRRSITAFFTLDRPAEVDVTFGYVIVPRTATVPDDFAYPAGSPDVSVTIPAGSSAATTLIPMVTDAVVEPDERFLLVVSYTDEQNDITGADLARNPDGTASRIAVMTIRNDD